jgi:uncharacterized protein (TIGR03435 family)
MKLICVVVVPLFAISTVVLSSAQNKPSGYTFEVSSVKPSNPSGGPGRGGWVGVGFSSCSGASPQITPDRFVMANASVYRLITMAYGMGECTSVDTDDLISGGPEWIREDRFDIQAVIPSYVPRYTGRQLNRGEAPELVRMIQTLLEDRFKLAIHRGTREIPVYALTVAKGGPKLKPVEDGACLPRPAAPNVPVDFTKGPPAPGPDEKPLCDSGGIHVGPDLRGFADSRATTLDALASQFGLTLNRTVINKTGIRSLVSFHVEFVLDPSMLRGRPPISDPDGALGITPPEPAGGPSIFRAFQDQLGLNFESTKAQVGVIVVDHVERPSQN